VGLNVLHVIIRSSDLPIIPVIVWLSIPIGIVLIILSIRELSKIFWDKRCKNPEKAVLSFYKVVLMGDDSDNFNSKSISYSYNSLLRMLPEISAVDFEKFSDWLGNFRKMIHETVDNDYKEVLKKSDPPGTYLSEVSFDPIKIKEKSTDLYIAKTRCIIHYYIDPSNQQNEDARVDYADFVINFEMLLIKSDKFWFLADPMPEYTFEYSLTEQAPTANDAV
jgi:hypothetical protein